MVRNRAAPPPIKNIPLFSKDLVRQDWTLVLAFDSDKISSSKVHVLQNADFTPKQIRSLLINEVAMTLSDLHTIQEFEIPKATIHDQAIHLNSGRLVFSILPSRSPTPLLMERASRETPGHDDADHVVWSTCSCEDAKEDEAMEFVCAREASYQDFLIHFSKHLGYDQGCVIEFDFLIHSKPVLFGRALCVAPDKKSPFFFARSLQCAALKKLFDKRNRD
jgi:hypothetical protein